MHIMLDIETMSIGKEAAIVSIGAVRFDVHDCPLTDTFYCEVNLKSSQAAGGKIDANTVVWWAQQSQEVRKVLYSQETLHIETALKKFSEWVREKPLTGIWGNGSDYDNVNVEGAYRRLRWTPPWTYKENRCYRTMNALFGEVSVEDFNTCPHNALSDAIYQAKTLQRIFKNVGYSG